MDKFPGLWVPLEKVQRAKWLFSKTFCSKQKRFHIFLKSKGFPQKLLIKTKAFSHIFKKQRLSSIFLSKQSVFKSVQSNSSCANTFDQNKSVFIPFSKEYFILANTFGKYWISPTQDISQVGLAGSEIQIDQYQLLSPPQSPCLVICN